ncbi:MAG TPA: translation elongation factor Ts [Chitinophagaceae bacterium]|jgi:elongation factor Ts|nr:translation elongation factor Ts [Bacteroidia bacterium]HMX78447.1 translation elongation factor Ts [Chitinophagaceae bacterium]HNO70349.1 translation elongation factor Ts [Bacteroidia bacterium]
MSSTATVSAAEVNRLRQTTGAGMMDCKKALTEASGDFDKAIEILRKKGQKVAASRAERDAKEGIVLAKTAADGKKAIIVSVNSETDFVARNEEFAAFVEKVATIALEKFPANVDALKALPYSGSLTINDKLTELIGKIGEKLDVSRYETIAAEKVSAYIHPGNKLAVIIGFTKNVSDEVGRNISMQAAAMAPVSIDKNDVPQEIIDRELEIGRELARKEGKPENMIDKIAQGKLNKFYAESTLVNQEYIRDAKKTVAQYLADADKEAKITSFKRIALG